MGDPKVKGFARTAGIVPTRDVVQTKVPDSWKARVERVSNSSDERQLIIKQAARPNGRAGDFASSASCCKSVNSFRPQGSNRIAQQGDSPQRARHVVPEAERVEPGNTKKLIAAFEQLCESAAKSTERLRKVTQPHTASANAVDIAGSGLSFPPKSSNTLTTDGAARRAVPGQPTRYPTMQLEAHLNVLKKMERELAGAESPMKSVEPVTIAGGGPGQDSGTRTVNGKAVREAMRSGQWQSTLLDLAPHVITSTPRWPRNFQLLIVDAKGQSLGIYGGEHSQKPSVVKLILNSGHYDVEIDGTLRKMPRDGNCFFHSICAGLGGNVNRLLSDGEDEPYQRLRKTVENLLIEHLPKYLNSLDEDDRKRYFLPASKA